MSRRTTYADVFLCAALGEEKYDAWKRKEKEMEVRSAWHHAPRIRLSEQKVVKLFLERGGCCCRCGRKLLVGDDYIVEHRIALENGGTNDWDNLDITGVTCCKAEKDAEDHGKAAENRSKATRHFLSKSMRKSKWPKRSFSKPERD